MKGYCFIGREFSRQFGYSETAPGQNEIRRQLCQRRGNEKLSRYARIGQNQVLASGSYVLVDNQIQVNGSRFKLVLRSFPPELRFNGTQHPEFKVFRSQVGPDLGHIIVIGDDNPNFLQSSLLSPVRDLFLYILV